MIKEDKMAYNFDAVVNRRGTDSTKWRVYGDDVLPLWVADMDFESPAPIKDAIIKRVEENVFGYGREPDSFRQILVERMKNLYNWSIQPNDIVFLPGLVCGLNVVSSAIGQPGDGTLVSSPVYPPFISAPTNQGRVTQMAEQQYSLVSGKIHYEIDFDVFEQTIQSNTSLFILCNPHNPTGRAYTRSELQRMAEIAVKHNLIICSDEIHCDLLLGNTQHIPIASIDPEVAKRTITLMAPSKTFNVPGLGCSLAIIPDEALRKQVQKAASGIVPHINVLGMVAGEAAYGDPECAAWLSDLSKYLTANRDFLVDYVGKNFPGVKTTSPEATYLAWTDWREVDLGESAYKFCLEQAKVAFNDGKNFGNGGDGFLRINMGCPRSTLEEALERVRHALSRR